MTYKEIFQSKIDSIEDSNLHETCEEILTNEKFFSWPASLSFHHGYEQGLIIHTLEVSSIAEDMCFNPHLTRPNKDVIIAACLWHDFLKTEEYLLVDFPAINQRYLKCKKGFFVKKVGEDSGHSHIINGAKAFRICAEKNNVDPSLIEQVEHCILAHHGPVKEWGSPVAPKTLEALIVHQADMLSAYAGITK